MQAHSSIAVTGASGFIGRALTKNLKGQGHEVVALVRSESSLKRLPAGVHGYVTDYSESDLVAALSGVDSLVHLAARRSTREDKPGASLPFLQSTGELIDPLLAAAKQNALSKIVTMSSIAVYSTENRSPYQEIDIPRPLNPYGLSKLAMEIAVNIHARSWPVDVTHLRLAACYGHGEKATGALMKFAALASQGEDLQISNGGSYQIDQIYIDDAVSAIIAALDNPGAGAVNIGSGVGYSVLEIANAANEVAGRRSRIHIEPEESDAKPAKKRHMGIDKAAQTLKWEPTFDLSRGLGAMYDISSELDRKVS